MNSNEKLQELLKEKTRLVNSLKWAINNNDRVLMQSLETELKQTMKSIKRIKKNGGVTSGTRQN